ncbi:hypothetical protein SAMN05444360_1067 [Chryseobacterium carnipullorum]|uniref:DUF5958 family protein n=1 Tax=Chryseobacterium carnipullorum TaxID=1124835 RepID=UPI0009131788|nr:DUF5958 family protein [Chryseobacterium carnipullorum]SHL92492.1 hypothetical protein SAMN05444360_1067 [Chryseobacterium carnipullorum]
MENIDYYANAFAQDKVSLEEIINFYEIFTKNDDVCEILNRIAFLMMQSAPQPLIVNDCIESLPRFLKKSSAASILKNNDINNAIRKILNLPMNEYKKSFMVMLYVFKASDTWRRENICKNNCNHEWHNIIW